MGILIEAKNRISYAGRDLADFGAYISGTGTFNAPERDVTSVSIPGRNGDLTLDNGRYKNIKVKYPAFIVEDFSRNIGALREYLLSRPGYQRLEDTYHPDEYRMARYSGAFTGKPVDKLVAGEFDLTFDCMPQRFLKEGEQEISFAANTSGSILNPSLMTAKPLLKVTSTSSGSGSISVGGLRVGVSFTAIPGQSILIDCETQEAYWGATSKNSQITLTDGEFPSLKAGANAISATNCQLVITPRWWCL